MDWIWETTSWDLTRFCFLRALGFIYFIAFLLAINQFKGLCGENGILPVRLFLRRVQFKQAPSIFWWNHSDRFIQTTAWFGLILSIIAMSSLSDHWGHIGSALVWFLLWMIYLSFVNVGQTFYGFGWESMLLETGFLTIFLGPGDVKAPIVVIYLIRWILFRNMFGAGLIKMRADPCWKNLTCLYYYYETQPLPNPISWYCHRLPKVIHKAGVLFNHFVELIVPWFYFAPPPFCYIAGILTLIFQFILIISGNLSWLNYLTIVLCISCFDDAFLSSIIPLHLGHAQPIGTVYLIVLGLATLFILILSIKPTMNLFARHQMMNASFDAFHLVNTYGAFGSITKQRFELIIEGTDEENITPNTIWKEYQFKGKPGDVARAPCIVSPYHWKLDWQMWFAAMSDYRYHPWILNLIAKLLQGNSQVIGLLKYNPFKDKPPRYIRVEWYLYHFTAPDEQTKNWWKRERQGEYLPPLSLKNHPLRL